MDLVGKRVLQPHLHHRDAVAEGGVFHRNLAGGRKLNKLSRFLMSRTSVWLPLPGSRSQHPVKTATISLFSGLGTPGEPKSRTHV